MDTPYVFIEKYFALYLNDCRILNPCLETESPRFPPTCEELREVMAYLSHNGSIATIKHLHVSKADIHNRTYKPTDS